MNLLAAAAASIGFAGVALGAFGAHGLRDRLSPEGTGWWETATLYALVHAAAALAIAMSGRTGLASTGGWALAGGALIFSGTLYAMALGAPRWLGAVTPIGGVGLLIGWGCLLAWAIRTAA
ncbi:MAG: DUF423 domain-containing protein [Pseudomonadota bacterium]